MKKYLIFSLVVLFLVAGVVLPAKGQAQTGPNFGITPGMTNDQIIQILVQVVQSLMQQIQTIILQRSQNPPSASPSSISTSVSPPAAVQDPTSSISILRPMSGETLALNSPYTVTWSKSAGVSGSIYLSGVNVSVEGWVTKLFSSMETSFPWDGRSVVDNNGVPVVVKPGSYQFVLNFSDGRPKVASGIFTITSGTSTSTLQTGTVGINVTVGGTWVSGAGSCVATIVGPTGNDTGSCLRTATGKVPGTYSVQWSGGYPAGADSSAAPTISPSQTLAGGSAISFTMAFQSTSTFITQPSITVLSPNGGETWKVGETRRIAWSSSNVSNVKIYLYDDRISGSGAIVAYPAGTNSMPASQGYFDWSIPSSVLQGNDGKHFQIQIQNADSYLYDTSDSYFTITPASPLTAPTSLLASVNASGQVVVSWFYPTAAVSGYKLERSTNSNGNFGEIASLVGGSASYVDSNVVAGNTYYYRIRAYNTVSGTTTYSDYSGMAQATIPGGSSTSVTLSVSSGGATPTNGYAGQTSTLFLSIKFAASGGDVTLTNIGVLSDSTNASQYLSNLRVFDGSTQVGSNTNLTSVGTVTVFFPEYIRVTNGSTKILNVYADISSSASGNLRLGINNVGYTNQGLQVSGLILFGNTMSITSGSSVLSTPTNLSAVLNNNPSNPSQVMVSWNYPTAAGFTGFKLERSTNSNSNFAEIYTAPPGTVTYFDNTTQAGSIYYYRVRAYNYDITANGVTTYSDYSNVSTVTTPGGVTAPSEVPSNLAATYSGSNQVTVSWFYSTAAVSGFKLERSVNSNSNFTEVASPFGGSASYMDSGVTAGNTYYYRLRAFNISGGTNLYSGYSNTAQVAIPVTPTLSISNPPAVGASWSAGSGQTFVWSTAGVPSNTVGTIQLTGSNGTSYTISNVVNAGSYTWSPVGTVSGTSIPAGNYTVKITMNNASDSAPLTLVAANILKGDVDGDGLVTCNDVKLIKQAAAGLISLPLNVADVDGNGVIQAADASTLMIINGLSCPTSELPGNQSSNAYASLLNSMQNVLSGLLSAVQSLR